MNLTTLRCKEAADMGTFWNYGRYETDRPRDYDTGDYFHPNYLAYGDYHGGTVEMANIRAWREEFSEGEGVWWRLRTGYHGSHEVSITVDECPQEALDILCALQEYPLISDDVYSALECELWDEGRENACSDVRYELRQRKFAPPVSDMVDNFSDRVILAFWDDFDEEDGGAHGREFEGQNPRYPIKAIADHIQQTLGLDDMSLFHTGEPTESISVAFERIT